MRKIYFLFFIFLITAVSLGQSVAITTVFDGGLASDGCSGSNGSSAPKGVELYVSGTVDFTGYSIESESNGSSGGEVWSAIDISSLGSVTDKFVYLIDGGSATTFTAMYPAAVTGPGPNGNGNDAYRIVNASSTVIDQFGNPADISGSSDISADWAYQDSYAKRNNNVPANSGTFNPSSFTYGGNQLFDDPNNTCSFFMSTVNFSSFTLSINEYNSNNFKIYPNPTSVGYVNISSTDASEMSVSVFNVLGKQVLNRTISNNRLNVSSLNSGIYIMKISQNDATITKKLVIK